MIGKNEEILLDLTNMIDNLKRAASVKAETEESKKIQTGINISAIQKKPDANCSVASDFLFKKQ